jgi:hypothetical protein
MRRDLKFDISALYTLMFFFNEIVSTLILRIVVVVFRDYKMAANDAREDYLNNCSANVVVCSH